jgi:hypothetical protein
VLAPLTLRTAISLVRRRMVCSEMPISPIVAMTDASPPSAANTRSMTLRNP